MGIYDQAQSARIAQRTGVEQPGIRLVYLEQLPEIAYKGQLIYNGTSDYLLVYDGETWQTIGDLSAYRLFVQSATPTTPNEGDQWYSPTTGILQVWDGTAWVEPTLPEDSVDTDQLAADAVTEGELEADAITAKHTITSAVFRTAASGQRMEIQNDTSGGVIKFFYGLGEALPGFINPAQDGSRPKLHLSSGTIAAGGGNSAQLELFGAFSGGAGKKAEFNCDVYMNGSLVSTSSRRYKENIDDIPYLAKDLLQLEPKIFNRIGEVKQEVGFIAEEADDLGLDAWVFRDPETGSVEAFSYVNWVVALQQIAREQQAKIESLEERLEALERRPDPYARY